MAGKWPEAAAQAAWVCAVLALAWPVRVLPEKQASKSWSHQRALIANVGLGEHQVRGEGAGELTWGSPEGK